MMSPEIIDSAFQYLQEVLDRNLPKDRCFHNLKHTKSVIKGAYELSNAMGVSKEEQQELILAAIFHDIGHVRTYMLHEEESKSIAHDFLSFKKYPEDKIEQVLKIIDATKMPQKPSTKLQMIICDADLAHLAKDVYFECLANLRKEWDSVLNQKYSDAGWKALNRTFLETHKYFTLEARKKWDKSKNLSLIDSKL